MGVELVLCWQKDDHHEERWKYILKVTYYPMEFYTWIDKATPNNDDINIRYLSAYKTWLKKILTICKDFPRVITKLGRKPKIMIETIQEDLKQIDIAIRKAKKLCSTNKYVWLHVG